MSSITSSSSGSSRSSSSSSSRRRRRWRRSSSSSSSSSMNGVSFPLSHGKVSWAGDAAEAENLFTVTWAKWGDGEG